jgi:hypothetical protein
VSLLLCCIEGARQNRDVKVDVAGRVPDAHENRENRRYPSP